MDLAGSTDGTLITASGDLTVVQSKEEIAQQILYVLNTRRASFDPLTGEAVEGEHRYDQADGIDLTTFFGGRVSDAFVQASIMSDLRKQVPAANFRKVSVSRTGTTIEIEVLADAEDDETIRAYVTLDR